MASTALPTPAVSQAEMDRWFQLTKLMAEYKVEEMLLRKRIFAAYFSQPVEGTNVAPLNEGWVIKGQYKIDRKVGIAALTTFTPMLAEAKFDLAHLIKYTPELVLSEYRKLNDDQVAIFNQVLVIKPGSPALEIMQPKR